LRRSQVDGVLQHTRSLSKRIGIWPVWSDVLEHALGLLTVTDSAGGTITRQYSDLDLMTSEAQTNAISGTAIGTVAYL